MHPGVAERIGNLKHEALAKKEADTPYGNKEEEESDAGIDSVAMVDDEYFEGFEDLGQSKELLQLHALKRQQQELTTQLKQVKPMEGSQHMCPETTRRISAREALKNNYTALVVDTNLLLNFPEIIDTALAYNSWPLIIPNPGNSSYTVFNLGIIF